MRESLDQANPAAVRVHEQCEDRVSRHPNPPRSEIVDMQVQEAWRREREIDAERNGGRKGEKVSTLRDAVVTPIVPPTDTTPVSDALMDELNKVLRNAGIDD